MVVEVGERTLLVDPMLGGQGTIPPFTLFRYRPKWNPLVDLPPEAEALLEKVEACLVTHSRALNIRLLQHMDHLDPAGEKFLRSTGAPVGCVDRDADYLRRSGLDIEWAFPPQVEMPFLEGTVKAVPAVHGYGWIHRFMANGVGFLVRFPGEPSLYISGDTVLTDEVRRVLVEDKPDVAIVAAGRARLDFGRPLLMNEEDLLEFIGLAPGLVVANHLEALNHCPVTREGLRTLVKDKGWEQKVLVPDDGERLLFEVRGGETEVR
jgi:L-ascorbate metabolism protein UlaG (beta-lactamase superfamily)